MVFVFDLDDTLFPEREFLLSGFRAVDAYLAASGAAPGFYEMAAILLKDGLRQKIFDTALQKLNANSSPESIQELVRVYRSHKPAIQLYPDASWILERLWGKAQLGIITDGFLKTQQNKVAALGIEGLFDCIVYSDSFGAAE